MTHDDYDNHDTSSTTMAQPAPMTATRFNGKKLWFWNLLRHHNDDVYPRDIFYLIFGFSACWNTNRLFDFFIFYFYHMVSLLTPVSSLFYDLVIEVLIDQATHHYPKCYALGYDLVK